ncbi:MAG: tetratricopeptide repeat protein [Caldilineae bacterium]|nr:MAG: tetratricopeptide repeat protein [Caldilineae bacterium]
MRQTNRSESSVRERARSLLERYAETLIASPETSAGSIDMVVNLLEKCLALEDDATYVRLLERFAVRLQREYNLAHVEAFLGRVLDHAGLTSEQAVAFADLRVRILIQLGEEALAHQTLDRVWPLACTPALRARVLNRRAYLYGIYSHYEEAERDYRAGLEVAQAGGDPYILAVLHSNYGDTLHQQGKYEAALEQYRQALAVARPHKLAFPCALAEGGLGMTLDQLQRYEEARQHHLAALAYYEEAGDMFGRIRIHLNLSYNALCRGDYERVKELAGQALAWARELEDLHRLAFAHQRLGEVFERTGEYDVACEHYLQALELRRQVGKPAFIRHTERSIRTLLETVRNGAAVAADVRARIERDCRRALEASPADTTMPPA